MSGVSTAAANDVRDFRQLVVDAVELAGAISPALKADLIAAFGQEFPSDMLPTIDRQTASLPAVLRMFVYARHEADQLSMPNLRRRLDTCVAFLLNGANCDRFGLAKRYH